MTTTLEDAHLARWRMIVPDLPYDHDFGIPTFWRQNPQLGSPLGPELDIGEGAKCQSFTGGVVVWRESTGAEIVSE